MYGLRLRRKEDQSSKSVSKKFQQQTFSCYKAFRQFLVMIGFLLFLFFILIITVNRLKIFLIYDKTTEDKYYSTEILHLFRKHDRDDDNYLSIDEFEPIVIYLNNRELPTDYIQPILMSDQLVTINAFFEPLNFSTMTKDFGYSYLVCHFIFFLFASISTYYFNITLKNNLDELQSLKLWKQPYIPSLNFAARHFKSFLPKNLEIGKPYWIIQGNQRQYVQHLSSNR